MVQTQTRQVWVSFEGTVACRAPRALGHPQAWHQLPETLGGGRWLTKLSALGSRYLEWHPESGGRTGGRRQGHSHSSGQSEPFHRGSGAVS